MSMARDKDCKTYEMKEQDPEEIERIFRDHVCEDATTYKSVVDEECQVDETKTGKDKTFDSDDARSPSEVSSKGEEEEDIVEVDEVADEAEGEEEGEVEEEDKSILKSASYYEGPSDDEEEEDDENDEDDDEEEDGNDDDEE
jgi:hypothetical protein